MRKINYTIWFICLFSLSVFGQQVYNKRAGNLYSDVKAQKIGDVITVLIQESTQSLNQSQTNTSKENALKSQSNAGTGLMKFFPDMSLGHTQSNEYAGTGKVESKGQFTSTMSVIIKDIREDGNYLVMGSKVIDTNGEKTVTQVTGVVRPDDISSDNTLYSSQIADIQIFHSGSGVVEKGHRPGFFTRLINWIF